MVKPETVGKILFYAYWPEMVRIKRAKLLSIVERVPNEFRQIVS